MLQRFSNSGRRALPEALARVRVVLAGVRASLACNENRAHSFGILGIQPPTWEFMGVTRGQELQE